MVTEQEAATKWCPHVVASHTDPRLTYADIGFNHACIASACMAWRTEWVESSDNPTDFTMKPGTRGYCGLAGKP